MISEQWAFLRQFLLFVCMITALADSVQAQTLYTDTLQTPTDSLVFLQDSVVPQLQELITEVDSTTLADSLRAAGDQFNFTEASEQVLQDNGKTKKKKTPELEPESYHARRAAMWGILPGGGQIYNKRWWKVPIAWGMIGAGGYFIYNSATKMRRYNKALDQRLAGEQDEFQNILNESQLVSYRNQYRRNLQLSSFGIVGLWGLTIIDAVVDAHLKTYDISDNLSIKFKPKVLTVANNSVPSFAITLFL